jgi:hypothetical protein
MRSDVAYRREQRAMANIDGALARIGGLLSLWPGREISNSQLIQRKPEEQRNVPAPLLSQQRKRRTSHGS